LAKVIRASDIGDQPVRRTMARMDVSVDKTGYHKTVGRIDRGIDVARKGSPDKEDRIPFKNQFGIAQQHIPS
jgi:hypothetical protein